jgi:hypothetical protein
MEREEVQVTSGAPSLPDDGQRRGNGADVFISYGSDDVALARELRRHLEAGDYSCWMAPDDVSGPKSWAEQIVDAIGSSKVMLVLISATSNQSSHVSKEVDLALGAGIAVLPVRVEDVAPSGALQYLLALAQWIDAFPGGLGPHADEVRRRVAAIIEAETPPAPPTEPIQTTPPPVALPEEPIAAPPQSSPTAPVAEPVPVAEPIPATEPLPAAAAPVQAAPSQRPAPTKPRPWWKRGWVVATAAVIVIVGAAGAIWAFTPDDEPEAPPSSYGDDATLDDLWDGCNGRDWAACDQLAAAAAPGTEYRAFGETCGGVVPGGGGNCADSVEPFTYGDDPELDLMWDECSLGNYEMCQALYAQSPVGSEYEWYGGSCGGTQDEATGCQPDLELEQLAELCAVGTMEACDELFLQAPVGSEYEEFGATCGFTRDPGLTCVYTYGDSLRLDEMWDACAAGDMPLCDMLYQEAPADSEYEWFGGTCGNRTDGADPCS